MRFMIFGGSSNSKKPIPGDRALQTEQKSVLHQSPSLSNSKVKGLFVIKNWWKTGNFPTICIIYAKLNTFFTTNRLITFELVKLGIRCNTLFCSVWRALSPGIGFFYFEDPPKIMNFQALQFCLETQKIANYSLLAQ